MDLGLTGKVALVTGASRGIGLACARALAGEGAVVVGVSRGLEDLGRARDELAGDGHVMHPMAADLRDPDAAAAMVAGVEAEHGPIAVLVNCAGAARRHPPAELDAAAYHDAMDAKYFTYLHVTQPVIALMTARGAGAVVNVIGQGGRRANPMHVAGGAANSALMLATVGLASAFAAQGVRVNAVSPGMTRTSRVEAGLEAQSRATGRPVAELRAANIAAIPMGRPAEPSEIADAVLFLASERAGYITGAIVPMDGGAASVI
ncbi:MAG: SDR family oxidoreductase [Terracoccus sp.]